MSNRFVQYTPFDYKPATYPLDVLKQTLDERSKLQDSLDDAQDKLAQLKVTGINGTGWDQAAAERNKTWGNARDQVSQYLIDNPGDLMGAKKMLRSASRFIQNDIINGKAGAIMSATQDYTSKMAELQKDAGKKDGFSHARVGMVDQMFKASNQDLGEFDPATQRYSGASSLQAPAYEYDLFGKMKEVLAASPEHEHYDVIQGRQGYELIDKVTGTKSKLPEELMKNFQQALATDSRYQDDLSFKTRYWAMSNRVKDPELIKQFQQLNMTQDINQILGYGYVNQTKPDLTYHLDHAGLEGLKHHYKTIEDKAYFDLNNPGNMLTTNVNMLSPDDPTAVAIGGVDLNNPAIGELLMEKKGTPIGPQKSNIRFGNQPTEVAGLNGEELNKIASLAKAQNPNFDSEHFVKWYNIFMDINKKKGANLSPTDAINAYNKFKEKQNKADPFPAYQIAGYKYETPEQRQRVTSDLLSNPTLDVILIKGGRVIKGGSTVNGGKGGDWNVHEMLVKYANDFKQNGRGDYPTTVGEIIPPIPKISKDYREAIHLSDGSTALVKINNNNYGNSDGVQLFNQLNEITLDPKAGKSVVISNAIDGEISQELMGRHSVPVPRNVAGYELVSKGFDSKTKEVLYEAQPYDINGRKLGKPLSTKGNKGKTISTFPLSSPSKAAMQIGAEEVKEFHGQNSARYNKNTNQFDNYRDITRPR